jgi:hypothetical protein
MLSMRQRLKRPKIHSPNRFAEILLSIPYFHENYRTSIVYIIYDKLHDLRIFFLCAMLNVEENIPDYQLCIFTFKPEIKKVLR